MRTHGQTTRTRQSISPPGGQAIVGQRAGDDPDAEKIAAFTNPRIVTRFLEPIFKTGILPSDSQCVNTLIVDHRLPKPSAEKCYSVILKNLDELGLLRTSGNKRLVQQYRHVSVTSELEEGDAESQPAIDQPTESPASTTIQQVYESRPRKVFIAHGKNKTELEQLKQLLKVVNITPVVAKDEPHAGMTISRKIPALMKECVAGIFIFTADEKVTDGEDKDVWRPSQNVIFELGLSIGLYGGKIIICKEESLKMASNFSDFGYTSFEKGNLIAKAADVLNELKKALGSEAVKLT